MFLFAASKSCTVANNCQGIFVCHQSLVTGDTSSTCSHDCKYHHSAIVIYWDAALRVSNCYMAALGLAVKYINYDAFLDSTNPLY